MPLTSRLARLVVAACLVVTTWLAAAPAPANALEPPRPLPGYRPAFVTETDVRPWRDCLWASGAMLLDKWTNGATKRSHQQLRRLSGDLRGGSDLADLRRAYARLGIDLTFSPDGGERITWGGLLKRLSQGAGAVLLGDYSDLPRYYGRWEYSFWKLTKDEKASKDNHAVYIERYDRRRGRVWLMDPLARGNWHGEWVSVASLRRYAWNSGGALHVAVTPTAKAAPFAGVTTTTAPKVSMNATTLDAAWGLTAPRRWTYPGADTRVTYKEADDPLRLAAGSLPVTVATKVDPAAPPPPARATAAVAGKALRASAAVPAEPGAYRTTITLKDRRFGREVVGMDAVAVFIPGPRRAFLRLRVRDAGIEAGEPVSVEVSVGNTGTLSWAAYDGPQGAPVAVEPLRNTRVLAYWIPLAVPGDGAGGTAPGEPVGVELRAVPLSPRKLATIRATLHAPKALGVWALVVDVVDDVDGSFAALGSAPAVQVFEVVTPRGFAPIE